MSEDESFYGLEDDLQSAGNWIGCPEKHLGIDLGSQGERERLVGDEEEVKRKRTLGCRTTRVFLRRLRTEGCVQRRQRGRMML